MKTFGDLGDSSSIDYCLIFLEAGEGLIFVSTNVVDSDKKIDESVLCYAGRACFVVTGPGSVQVWGTSRCRHSDSPGSSRAGGWNNVVRRHACSQELAPLPRDLI